MATFFKPRVHVIEKEVIHHPWERRIKDAYSHQYKYGHNSVENPPYPKLKEPNNKDRTKLFIIGTRTRREFIYCYYLAKGLYKHKKKQFEQPIIRGVTSVEWNLAWHDLKIQYGSKAYCITSEVAVIVNNVFLGGEKEFKEYIESQYVYHLCIDYYHEAIKQFASFINPSGRPCAYMHISIDGEEAGNLIFMLYADLVPRTCENFLRLCSQTKGGYAGTPVHRIVKDGWIQCGGFGLKDTPDLGCENFIVPHDRRGVLCMANDSRHVDCSTQFFVLLQPAPWMQHKYVAFGQLIEGDKTLTKIENVPEWGESPTKQIIIYKAGVFNIDCQYIPINKNTNAYLHGHTENLYNLGMTLYEELLQRVFQAIELKRLRKIAEEEAMAEEEDLEGKGKKHSPESASNDDFDVEQYQYEGGHYTYSQVSMPEPSIVVEPDIPYYIPLTDVPYPGEISSAYDLKKYLMGNMCYEADIEPNPEKRKKLQPDVYKRLSIPEELLGALFECFAFGDNSDDEDTESTLSSTDIELIDKYVGENMDNVSFAGPVIKQIANIGKKYDIFDETKREPDKCPLLTDEELRIIRMAQNEYRSTRSKKVSICLSSSKLSHTKVIRRPTGYIGKEELVKFGLDSETYESLEEEELGSEKTVLQKVEELPHEPRKVVIVPDVKRASVLGRLFEETAQHIETDIPTFKDYKPAAQIPEKSQFVLLTYSPTYRLEDESEKTLHHQPPVEMAENIGHALLLQHGPRIYRKLSSDYVRTIDHLEHKKIRTIRTLEFSKKRPAMSVSQYKMRNKVYNEKLKAERIS